jgi:Sulfotransferase family
MAAPSAYARYYGRRVRRLFRRASRLDGTDVPDFPVPFVVGVPRSGTTLMRLMLDAHPDMAIPSETHFITDVARAFRDRRINADQLIELLVAHNRWGDFHLDADELRARFERIEPLNAADAVRAFYRQYAEKQGKPRWGDKTPGYVKKLRVIGRLFPEARLIHIIRDGRDVALSVIAMNWGPSDVPRAAQLWDRRIREARGIGATLPHYKEVRYEDLVEDTEPVLRDICDYIELDFDPVMLDYHRGAARRLKEKERDLSKPGRVRIQPAAARMASHALATRPPQTDRLARWRTEMSPEDVAAYESIAGELLSELGYELAG